MTIWLPTNRLGMWSRLLHAQPRSRKGGESQCSLHVMLLCRIGSICGRRVEKILTHAGDSGISLSTLECLMFSQCMAKTQLGQMAGAASLGDNHLPCHFHSNLLSI